VHLCRSLLLACLLAAAPACSQESGRPSAETPEPHTPDAFEWAVREAGPFSGAVLVARGDSVLYAAGFGHADREENVPNTSNTRFRIASVTKQFTAALVLQLVEEGRVALDAPITTYLSSAPAAPGVTTHHLLTHTSGIPEGRALRDRDLLLSEYLSRLGELSATAEPGERYAYSNPNYHLLGLLVEAVTGRPYADALRERLLTPLGLADTGVAYAGDAVEGLAEGYARTAFGYRPESPFDDAPHTYAAGAMYSTVHDLFRWTRALHRGEPFRDPATLALMLRPHVGAHPHPSGPTAYGYGITLLTSRADSSVVYMHDGRHGPFVSDLRYLSNGDYTVVTLGNADGNETTVTVDVANALVRLLR
jgi:CubicO group peptidase (beta-lactamase class C family)